MIMRGESSASAWRAVGVAHRRSCDRWAGQIERKCGALNQPLKNRGGGAVLMAPRPRGAACRPASASRSSLKC